MSFNSERAVKAAWIAWAALFVATAAIIAAGSTRSVIPAYRLGAENWLAGRSLYDGMGVGGFVYLPQSAVLFMPFSLFPAVAGEVLWRLANIGVFAAGLLRFGRLGGERTGDLLFPLMSAAAVPLVWDCARNGQATLAMAGLMLLAVVDMARASWWRAALWLALAAAVKPLVVVLILLAAAIEPSLRWRVTAALGVVVAAPFLMQRPDYVIQQYAGFWQNSMQAAHVGVAAQGWSHPFSALRVAGIVVPEKVQTAVRLAAAPATLGLIAVARRRLTPDRAAVYLYSLAAAYLLLFSPRTENNTHMLFAPSIAFFLAEAVLVTKRRADVLWTALTAVAFIAGRPIQRLLAPQAEQVWLSPLLAVLFTGYLLIRLVRDMRQAEEQKH